MRWRIVTYRLSSGGAAGRVGIWRELRRLGAVALQAATWALPHGEHFDAGLLKVRGLVERAGGQLLVVDVDPQSGSVTELEAMYTTDREAEWVEFISECDKAIAELAGEIAKQKFTLAELDEEEHNIERLRRWYRELRTRDILGVASATLAETKLKEAAAALDTFADHVYEARQHP